MGERKGQNFYYPPDFDPKVHGSLNGYHGVHALRERARKMDRGILIIRFEMPYNIWCEGCKKHIGMGVRFNAEKTKVGMYYTTPVYQFRMKCHLCTNHFSIKTDPANMDYVIVDGASRQERRWDPTENGQVVPDDKSVGKKLADDAMYKLEHVGKDKNKMADVAPRLVGVYDIQDRTKDDYMANRLLRDKFRKRKKAAKAKQDADAEVLKKNSLPLDIGLVDECPEDVKFAQLLSIQARKEAETNLKEDRDTITDQDIFKHRGGSTRKKTVVHTAKNVIKKVIGSEQIKLLKDKGFGTIVKKTDTKMMQNNELCAKKESLNSQKMHERSDSTLNVSSVAGNSKSDSATNSLSLLANYSDSNEDSD